MMRSRGSFLALFMVLILTIINNLKSAEAFCCQQYDNIKTKRFSRRQGRGLALKAKLGSSNDESDEEEEEDSMSPYEERAASEFLDSPRDAGDMVLSNSRGQPTTAIDWGGALGTLRDRMDDVESGKSQDPAHALFRLLSAESPNQSIGKFITSASPKVVQAMSTAVSSLLGGLSNPAIGVETIVSATGDKVASLCFQLQMTGYLFRNAEYVVALKKLMKLPGGATLKDYRDAFDKLDHDGSGFIEASEVKRLFDNVYDGKPPAFEIEAFLKYFDTDKDGKISWDEFQSGLFGATDNLSVAQKSRFSRDRLLPAAEEKDPIADDLEVTGEIEIEFDDGRNVTVNATEYIAALKSEAKALREALAKSSTNTARNGGGSVLGSLPQEDDMGGIMEYIESRKGDVKAMTEGISPEIVETMRLLIDFVLEGGDFKKGKEIPKEEMSMELPAAALQQLALWQLVLGYKLREAEAKGEYLRLLD